MKFCSSVSLQLLGVSMLVSSSAFAGPYTDDLSKCLVSATTTADRTALVRWMFVDASSHPALKNIAKVSPAEIDDANKTAGRMFTRLLTESCRAKTQDALKYEGPAAIQTSFTVLGQIAGRELFADPSVVANMASLPKYLDKKKLQELAPSSKQ